MPAATATIMGQTSGEKVDDNDGKLAKKYKKEKVKKNKVKTKKTESKTNGPSSSIAQRFRPPQTFLNIFWQLSDGETESQRNKAAVQLFESISKAGVS